MPQSILIVGGGFGGVEAAKTLARSKMRDVTVRLIDAKTYFEYHAALYRFITGRSPMEVCIPYRQIFAGLDVDVVQDRVDGIDLQKKTVTGRSGSSYRYDTLILALGSETTYFGVAGVKEYAYGMKTAEEALKLKMHILETVDNASTADKDAKTPLLHLVVVGGGPSGVELAGELGWYVRMLAQKRGIDPSLCTVDLIEAMPRLLPCLPESAATQVEARLRSLGVNVYLNRSLVKEDFEEVYLKDMQMKTKTVVWTAGMRGHSLYERTLGLSLDRRYRIEVDDQLHVKDQKNVFAIGDSASTKWSGMAQTAFYDGHFVAKVIEANLHASFQPVYTPSEPHYAMPVGPKWAVSCFGGRIFSGYAGWILRRYADLRVFLKLLPPMQAFSAFRSLKKTGSNDGL